MKTLIQIVCCVTLAIFSSTLAFGEISIDGEIPQDYKLGAYDIHNFIEEYNLGKITIIDVRSAEEYSMAHLDAAINLPLDTGEFLANLDSLESYKQIVLQCVLGKRALKAYKIIEEKRPDLVHKVKFLDAKVTFKANGDMKIKPNN